MSARSRKSKVYGDFNGDVRKEPKEFCQCCQRWIPPCYFKRGKPVYVHSCCDAKEVDDAI